MSFGMLILVLTLKVYWQCFLYLCSWICTIALVFTLNLKSLCDLHLKRVRLRVQSWLVKPLPTTLLSSLWDRLKLQGRSLTPWRAQTTGCSLIPMTFCLDSSSWMLAATKRSEVIIQSQVTVEEFKRKYFLYSFGRWFIWSRTRMRLRMNKVAPCYCNFWMYLHFSVQITGSLGEF